MRVDGAPGEHEFVHGLLVGHVAREEAQDLELARTERSQLLILATERDSRPTRGGVAFGLAEAIRSWRG
jgi:hypothetical protein